MREIKVSEAKSRFSELLRMVEHGETIAITRHRRKVAHLVPAVAHERASRQAAVERFRQRRAGWRRVNISIEEILAWRHEGHRNHHPEHTTSTVIPNEAERSEESKILDRKAGLHIWNGIADDSETP